jgi:selenocysteine-specific elongation factor
VPGDRSVRVREFQVHAATVDVAAPGRTALNLAGIEAADLHRGLVLTDDPAVVASDRLLVRLATPLPDRARARIHLGTAAVDATVGRSGRDAIELQDGSSAAILRLATPIAVASGDRAVLRRTSGADRIVGTLVLDPAPARGISRRRQSSERVGRLASAALEGDGSAVAVARRDLHGALPSGDRPDAALGLAPDVEAAVADAVLEAIGEGATLTQARAAAVRALRRQVTIERTAATSTAAGIVDRLEAGGRLVRTDADVRPPGAVEVSSAPDPDLVAAMDRLERILAVVAPSSLADAAREAACPPAGIRALERSGRIVVLEPDLAYANSTYRELTAHALALATDRPLTPATLRDATGTSRKYVMAILTDLDRRGFLRRTPDGHVPGPRAPATSAAP